MNFVCYNSEMLPAEQPLFTATNRSFKYGDGVFETIKVYNHTILLAPFHFDRLFSSLLLLKIEIKESLTAALLSGKILELCQLNHCATCGRVRLAVYRTEENGAEYVIEALPLPEELNQLNKEGFRMAVFPDARKGVDAFANLKTANYLLYVLADKYAREKGLNEALVLNAFNKICDASKANLFLLLDKEIITPALHQGCVNGVMRRYVIENLKKTGYVVHQTEVDEALLYQADEVFLTNAIVGMRWVQSFEQKQYAVGMIKSIYEQLFTGVYHLK